MLDADELLSNISTMVYSAGVERHLVLQSEHRSSWLPPATIALGGA